MDEVGAMSAIPFAGSDVLTARMDQTNFRGPIPVGENVLIESYVYGVGNTSVRARVRTSETPPGRAT